MITVDTSTPNILIFDSGIGGLSIVAEITQYLPQHPLIYVADNRLFPYGIQSDESLLSRAKALFPVLESDYKPAIIIIACNSASTLVLNEVRALVHTPVIGVVPAIKPAAQLTQTGVIGLLATKGTVCRPYTQELIDQFAKDTDVIRVGSDVLVSQAEQKMQGKQVQINAIRKELTPLLDNPSIDTVVLGCTHFPLIRDEIQEVLNSSVTLIDSGEAIARRAHHILSKSSLLRPASVLPGHTFVFTTESASINKITPTLHARGFIDIQVGHH